MDAIDELCRPVLEMLGDASTAISASAPGPQAERTLCTATSGGAAIYGKDDST
jgi:hypothetical protein